MPVTVAPKSALAALAVFSAVFSAVWAATPDAAEAQGRPAAVDVDFVDVREIAETRPVIGRFVAAVESDVAARVDGVVAAVEVEVGDRAAAGETIAALETEVHEIERRARASTVMEAEASASVAEAQLRLAEQSLARAARLRGSTAFSQSNVEDLEQRVAEAMAARVRAFAAVETARAELARADYTLRWTKIIAPFDGVVVQKSAQPGQYIRIGDPIATLLDVDALEIEADVPSDLIGGVTPGVAVEAVFEAGASAVATVRAAVPSATVATRTRPVRFALDLTALDPSLIAAGEAVTLFVPSGAPRSSVTAPKDALVHSSGGWIMYVVEDGKAQPRSVAIGAPAGDRVEIRAGVAPGDQVVIRGNERLRPGQAVTPRQAEGGEARSDKPAQG